MRGVDHLVVPHVHPHMRDRLVEEKEISGPQGILRHVRDGPVLSGRGVWKRDPALGPSPHGETRTVETLLGIVAAPLVRDSDDRTRGGHGGIGAGVGGRRRRRRWIGSRYWPSRVRWRTRLGQDPFHGLLGELLFQAFDQIL